jgi:predicted Zn-dependent protease
MVAMQMGDEDGVQAIRDHRRGALAHEVGDAPAQHGIGQQTRAAEVDERRRVAEPGDAGRRPQESGCQCVISW